MQKRVRREAITPKHTEPNYSIDNGAPVGGPERRPSMPTSPPWRLSERDGWSVLVRGFKRPRVPLGRGLFTVMLARCLQARRPNRGLRSVPLPWPCHGQQWRVAPSPASLGRASD